MGAHGFAFVDFDTEDEEGCDSFELQHEFAGERLWQADVGSREVACGSLNRSGCGLLAVWVRGVQLDIDVGRF